MADKFVLVPHHQYEYGNVSHLVTKGKAPPPGIPPSDEIVKSMEIVTDTPSNLPSVDLAYVNTNKNPTYSEGSDSEEESDTSAKKVVGGGSGVGWGKVWQRV